MLAVLLGLVVGLAVAEPPVVAAPERLVVPLPRITLAPGKGLMLSLPDDSMSLQVRARIQARGTMLTEPMGQPLAEPNTEMTVRRARLLLTGTLMKDWAFYFQLGFSNQDTESDLRLPLRDAHVTFTRWRDVNLRVGQMKVPFDRQRVTSSSAMQFPDRSLAVGEFNLDRDVGVVMLSDDLLGLGKRLAYWVGLFGGDGRNRLSDTFGLLAVTRVEFRPFGGFDDLVEADLERRSSPKLAFAFALAHNRYSNRDRSTHGRVFTAGRTDYAHANVDALFKWRGFSLAGQALCRVASQGVLEAESGGRRTTEKTRSGCGAFVQGGIMLTDHLETAARLGEVRPLSWIESDVHISREVGGAVSVYLHRHDLKVQSDYFYLFGEDPGSGRHQARVQVQLYF